jgi:16S rRNA (uracil1498-N3)-methyltransferase
MIYIEDEGDVRHIRNVLRMKPGDSIIAADGAGREYTGTIEEIGGAVTLSVVDMVHAAEPRTKVTLYQCVPKQGKMETVIQKSTELGAVAFVPVFSQRSVPKPSDPERKAVRWQRVAAEASKQSGRAVIPTVDIPLSLADAACTFGKYDLALFPYEKEGRVTIKGVLRKYASHLHTIEGNQHSHRDADAGRRIAVIIGPEGGFTDEEALRIEGAGAAPCSLGSTVLRAETAGPAAISMIMYELEL